MTSVVMLACRLEEKTGRIFARELRNAGLIRSGGKGVNAPHMTECDLASLLIALLSTDKPARAVELTKYVGEMQLQPGSKPVVSTHERLSDPDHTFRDLMQSFCDPEIKTPNKIRITVEGTALASVENEGVWNSDGESPSFLYTNRDEMQKTESLWNEIQSLHPNDERFKALSEEMFDSRISMHGLTTSRSISGDTIEAIKAIMFRDHYAEMLSESAYRSGKSLASASEAGD
ncbi:MAG: hypothetical protein AAGI03_04740 [Pseudomonadota bacterium]